MEREDLIRELNHHIRNSLQIISNAFAEADEAERERVVIRGATDRILSTLEKYLPMPANSENSERRKQRRQIAEEQHHPRTQD